MKEQKGLIIVRLDKRTIHSAPASFAKKKGGNGKVKN